MSHRTLRYAAQLLRIPAEWGAAGPPVGTVPEGWYRAAVIHGELLADEFGDPVYCVAFAFLEPAFAELVAFPFAVCRLSLVGSGVASARRLLAPFGIREPSDLRDPLPRLYARVRLGPDDGFWTALNGRVREVEVVPAHIGDGRGLDLPPLTDCF